MMAKKVLSAVLVLTLCLGVLAGCESETEPQSFLMKDDDGDYVFSLTPEEFVERFNKKVADDPERMIGDLEIHPYLPECRSYSYDGGVSVSIYIDANTSKIEYMAWSLNTKVDNPASEIFGRNVSTTIKMLDPQLTSDEGIQIINELHMDDIDSFKVGFENRFETEKRGISYEAYISEEYFWSVVISAASDWSSDSKDDLGSNSKSKYPTGAPSEFYAEMESYDTELAELESQKKELMGKIDEILN